MQARLVVVGGKYAGKVVPLSVRKFFIGRAPDCQLRATSELISRHHCVIVLGENDAVVRDLGSRTGTRVNGQEVKGQQALRSGDRLAIGHFEFEVQVDAPAKDSRSREPDVAPTPPAPTAAPAAEQPAAELQEQPAEDVSEAEKEERRRRLPMVGVSKTAQGRREVATPRDAAAEALRKFFGRK